MAELARGTVADRPWGKTLGALGLRRLSGQLTLTADGKRYQIAFSQGIVIAATSPLASDAAARVALTSGLMSSSQVADIARRQAAAPGSDEIDVIAELIRLAPDQSLRLRRRVTAQRAARTFSIDRGEFSIEDRVTLPIVAGSELDIRSVIYLGARQNLSEARLEHELAQLGSSFRLKPSATEDLPQFGFSDSERPVLELLGIGASIADLDQTGVDQRLARAMVYSLACCNLCDAAAPGAGAAPMKASGPLPSVASGPIPAVRPAAAPPAKGSGAIPTARTTTSDALAGGQRQMTSAGQVQRLDSTETPTLHKQPLIDAPTVRKPAGIDAPTTSRTATGSRGPGPKEQSQRLVATVSQSAEVKRLIDERLALLDRRASHYELLGVPIDASAETIRKAYFALARNLHPDRLAALGISDENRLAQRLFAEVNAGFAVLSDPARRSEYTDVLRRGGEAAIRAEQSKAEEMAARILQAEESFRRGEAALRRDQLALAMSEFAKAIELDPNEADYHALHAWTQFCASPDKMAISTSTRTALERAIEKSPRGVTARFYLGRVERMLGRDREALRHFKDVLLDAPHHTEANSEVRVIEARLAAGGDKGGLFNRSKR